MDIITEVSKLLNSVPDEALVEPPDPNSVKVMDLSPRRLYKYVIGHTIETASRDAADLVGSRSVIGDDMHWPAIDIDHRIRAVPSGSPGCNHLYIDVPMHWKKYKKLLKALVEAGLVEKGYYKMAKKNKETHLRLPEKPKGGSGTTNIPPRTSAWSY
jgi:hypothetical protein